MKLMQKALRTVPEMYQTTRSIHSLLNAAASCRLLSQMPGSDIVFVRQSYVYLVNIIFHQLQRINTPTTGKCGEFSSIDKAPPPKTK